MSKIFVALMLVTVLFYCGCDESPTETNENPVDSLDMRITIKQYQNQSEFVELGNFEFNVNQTINLLEAAHKEVSFISEAVTIHTFVEVPSLNCPEIFFVMTNSADSTYMQGSQQISLYTTIIANIPNNINFNGTIYAFLVSDIEGQIEDTIFMTIESENYIDTLLIVPNIHTFDLDISLSILSDSLSFVGNESIDIRFYNNSTDFCGVISNHYVHTIPGIVSWRLRIIKEGETANTGSSGFPLAEYFTFYGFKLQNNFLNTNKLVDWKYNPLIVKTSPIKIYD